MWLWHHHHKFVGPHNIGLHEPVHTVRHIATKFCMVIKLDRLGLRENFHSSTRPPAPAKIFMSRMLPRGSFLVIARQHAYSMQNAILFDQFCLSVRLPNAGAVSKRIDRSSHFFTFRYGRHSSFLVHTAVTKFQGEPPRRGGGR